MCNINFFELETLGDLAAPLALLLSDLLHSSHSSYPYQRLRPALKQAQTSVHSNESGCTSY